MTFLYQQITKTKNDAQTVLCNNEESSILTLIKLNEKKRNYFKMKPC